MKLKWNFQRSRGSLKKSLPRARYGYFLYNNVTEQVIYMKALHRTLN